jgi:hypothetical protein
MTKYQTFATWLDKPILREFFWFIVLPEKFRKHLMTKTKRITPAGEPAKANTHNS